MAYYYNMTIKRMCLFDWSENYIRLLNVYWRWIELPSLLHNIGIYAMFIWDNVEIWKVMHSIVFGKIWSNIFCRPFQSNRSQKYAFTWCQIYFNYIKQHVSQKTTGKMPCLLITYVNVVIDMGKISLVLRRRLAIWGRMTLMYFRKLYQHWFRWPVTCSASHHYLNQFQLFDNFNKILTKIQ